MNLNYKCTEVMSFFALSHQYILKIVSFVPVYQDRETILDMMHMLWYNDWPCLEMDIYCDMITLTQNIII